MEIIQPKNEEKHRINWKTRFKMAINTYLSIITLNVNGLNAPIKRQSDRLDKKAKISICCLQETPLTDDIFQRTTTNNPKICMEP